MLGNYALSEDTLSAEIEVAVVGGTVLVSGGGDVVVAGIAARLSTVKVSGGGDARVTGGRAVRITQEVIEAVHGANANLIVTQFVIEVAIKRRPSARAWGQIIGA